MTEDGWLRFRYADVFSESNQLGNWVACLALIANDLVQTNARLIELLEEEGQDASEALYYFWLSAAHYREAAKFLGETLDRPEIDQFIASLPERAGAVLGAVRKTFEPWDGSLVKEVAKPLRDSFFHYPRPDSEEWIRVWQTQSDREGSIRHAGLKVKEVRLAFGDDLRVSLMSHYLGESLDAIGKNLEVLGDVVGKLAVFAQYALAHYLSRLPPDSLVRGKPQETIED